MPREIWHHCEEHTEHHETSSDKLVSDDDCSICDYQFSSFATSFSENSTKPVKRLFIFIEEAQLGSFGDARNLSPLRGPPVIG